MRICLVLASLVLAAMSLAQEIRVEVNGTPASYDGTAPKVIKGRVLIPVRGTLDQFGVNMNWDPDTQVFTAEKDDLKVTMKIGDKVAYRNGDPVTLDVPGQILEGRTLVPLRFLSECFGATVQWDGIKRLVTITTPGPTEDQRNSKMVGMTGFEPATSSSRTTRSTKLSHIPTG